LRKRKGREIFRGGEKKKEPIPMTKKEKQGPLRVMVENVSCQGRGRKESQDV